jgi:hypothetical protein
MRRRTQVGDTQDGTNLPSPGVGRIVQEKGVSVYPKTLGSRNRFRLA